MREQDGKEKKGKISNCVESFIWTYICLNLWRFCYSLLRDFQPTSFSKEDPADGQSWKEMNWKGLIKVWISPDSSLPDLGSINFFPHLSPYHNHKEH